MAHQIDYKIQGDDMQLVEIELDPKEGVRAEVGTMLYMEEKVEIQTSTGGGLWKGFKRMLTGDSFFISSFMNNGTGKKHVAFGAPYPGKIVPLDLKRSGGKFLCQKDSFLCAAEGIDIDIAFTKRLGAGLFGGEGLFLAMLRGPGKIYLQSLPFSRLADRIQAATWKNREERGGIAGIGESALGGILGGDRKF